MKKLGTVLTAIGGVVVGAAAAIGTMFGLAKKQEKQEAAENTEETTEVEETEETKDEG